MYCLDSGIFGIDGTINLLKVMIEQREQGFKQAIFNCNRVTRNKHFTKEKAALTKRAFSFVKYSPASDAPFDLLGIFSGYEEFSPAIR